MSTADIALLVSIGSLIVAGTSLGWNIYRDAIMKPKLRVAVHVGRVIQEPYMRNLDRLIVTATNMGPGKTRAEMICVRKSSWWRRLVRCCRRGIVIFDYQDRLSGRLPASLDAGEKVDLTFRFVPDLFITDDFNQVGISDPFGKVHWCRKSEYRRAQQDYAKAAKNDSSDVGATNLRTSDDVG
jgi:hypothetical protein